MPEAIKLSEWIDKLCGIMIKMHYLNHKKLEIRKKKKLMNTDLKQLHDIQVAVDNINEQRYAVWNEIDKIMLKIQEGKYRPQIEERTYGK